MHSQVAERLDVRFTNGDGRGVCTGGVGSGIAHLNSATAGAVCRGDSVHAAIGFDNNRLAGKVSLVRHR